MLSIQITPDELLKRTQTHLATALVERSFLKEMLDRCAEVMTPEQLRQVGIATEDAPVDAPTVDMTPEAFAEMVAAGEVVETPTRKNGKAAAHA